jgi:hypothetical protein
MTYDTQTTDELIDTLYSIRESKYQVKHEMDKLDKVYDEIENELMHRCTNNNIKTMGTTVAKISLSESVVPNVEDWDKLQAYIKENDAFFLLKRQVNVGPYREIVNAGDSLPGVVPFTKLKLSLTKA